MIKTIFKKLLLIAIVMSLAIFWGCESAKEKVEEVADKAGEMANETVEKTGDLAEEAAKKVEETAEKVTDAVENNFLVGTWTGKFDGRKTVFVVTEQDGNHFEGKITINYRDVINQEVKGSFDPENNAMSMEDQLHSRFKGTYNGKLSEDQSTYSGQFTMKHGGTKFNFNLKKN